MLFEPGDAFGVQMVGRFVEQQDRRLFEQQARQRDAAFFAAREIFDARVAGRSEEHTSELQSLMRISYAVFCLKKKIKYIPPQMYKHNHNDKHTEQYKTNHNTLQTNTTNYTPP